MGDKTAIERLRALLNERGATHVGGGEMVRWVGKDGCVCRAYSRRGDLCLDVSITYVSPERAIDATLGRGTCHDAAGKQMAFFACSACGSTDERKKPRFCHECGRRVVDDVLRTE